MSEEQLYIVTTDRNDPFELSIRIAKDNDNAGLTVSECRRKIANYYANCSMYVESLSDEQLLREFGGIYI